MNIEDHKKEFDRIVKEYKLGENKIASDISSYLTSGEEISYVNFSKKFDIEESDAKLFLSFILKGIKFKEEHIDKK